MNAKTKKQEAVEVVETVEATTTPVTNITPEDFGLLVGPFRHTNAMGEKFESTLYRLISQVIQDTAYSCMITARAARAKDSSNVVADQHDAIDDADSSTPFKDGIDATLETVEQPAHFSYRPRASLLTDILRAVRPNLTDEDLEKTKEDFQKKAIENFVNYQAKGKPFTSDDVRVDINIGARILDEDDGTYDHEYLLRSVEFTIKSSGKSFRQDDKDNRNMLIALRDGEKAVKTAEATAASRAVNLF